MIPAGEAQGGVVMPDETKDLQPTPSLADAARKWLEIRDSIYRATAQGLGKWLAGAGDPAKILNPFSSLAAAAALGQNDGPGRLKGVGKMAGRLRLTEDEKSKPMASLHAAAMQNPLIQQSTVKVEDLPPGATGRIRYPAPGRPEISLAPVVSPSTDPGVVATHEIAGHGSHGPVGGRAKDQQEEERVIGPKAEGTAEGVVKGLYGTLAPPSAYDQIYGEEENYWRAKGLGRSLAQHIATTGHVPPWQKVQDVIFGKAPAPKPKPEAPAAQGPLGNPKANSSPGPALRALGVRPKQVNPPGPGNGSSPADAMKAFGIKPLF